MAASARAAAHPAARPAGALGRRRAASSALVATAGVALILAAASAEVVRVPLDRTVFQETVHLPLAGSAVRGNYNLMLTATEGHDVAHAVSGICSGVAASFNATGSGYEAACPGRIADLVRESRGLDMQHEAGCVALSWLLGLGLGC